MSEIQSEDLKEFSIKQNILIVEDSEDMQLLLKKRLKHLFKNVDIASNGKEAIQKYQKGKYQIILSDIRMPEMDGIEFLEEVRKDDLDQKVIFMSAHDDSYYYNQLLNANANGFVLKPINISKLLNILYINSKNAFEKEEHDKNIERIKILYEELSIKNANLTKSNLKFRYLYKKLHDKLEKEIDEVISKRKFEIDEIENQKPEPKEIKINKPIKDNNPILMRKQTSAKEYLDKIEFSKYNEEMIEELQQMNDLEDDLKDVIDSAYEKGIVESELINLMIDLFLTYTEMLEMLADFDTILNALYSLIDRLKQINYEIINENSNIFLDYIYFLIGDLKKWRESIFIEQNALDIHYLDDSLMDNCVNIENYIIGDNGNDSEDNDDMFFF